MEKHILKEFILIISSYFLVQHVAAHLLSHLSDTLDTSAVQVTVVLARLDEPMALDVLLHLFP